jgi:hypothetical protein
LALGASIYEVYSDSNLVGVKEGGKGTIYQRYTVDELRDWVEHLYKEAVKKYHPDLHGGDQYYVDLMATINLARDRALYILKC